MKPEDAKTLEEIEALTNRAGVQWGAMLDQYSQGFFDIMKEHNINAGRVLQAMQQVAFGGSNAVLDMGPELATVAAIVLDVGSRVLLLKLLERMTIEQRGAQL